MDQRGRQFAIQMQLMCAANRAGKLELADLRSVPALALLRAVAEEASSRAGPERLTLDDIGSAASTHIASGTADPSATLSISGRVASGDCS